MTTDIHQRYLRTASASDVGRERTLNEDSFCVDEALGLLLVADGMGGHEAGEVASREVVAGIRDYLRRHQDAYDHEATERVMMVTDDGDSTWEDLPNPIIEVTKAALEHANQRVYTLNQERGYPEGKGMGTTVAGLWQIGELNEAVIFHVGDSRLYLYRSGRLMLLTRDHSLYQQWESSGRIGPAPSHNIILRSLGASSHTTADIRLQSLHNGDLILICSDGLTSMVSDAWIEAALRRTEPERLEATCAELVEQANAQGGNDNITLILAWYGKIAGHPAGVL